MPARSVRLEIDWEAFSENGCVTRASERTRKLRRRRFGHAFEVGVGEALGRTFERRPDLLEGRDMSPEETELLVEYRREFTDRSAT